mgnify:CR=1 FL=1
MRSRNMLVEHFADVRHELVHIVVGLVDIVVDIVTGGLVVDEELHELSLIHI